MTYRTWQEAMEYVNVVDDWKADRECWPEWCWPHVTDTMANGEDNLPFRLIYAALVDRSGLPPMTRAVLHYLARRCGGSKGKTRRCWPPLDTIADRVGIGRTTAKRAIRDAEDHGWLLVVRYPRRVSDYVLDVPDMKSCPCLDCRSPERTANTRGGQSEPLEGQSEPLGGQSEPLRGSERPTHLVHSRGSPTGSTNLRTTPNGVAPVGAVKDKKEGVPW